MNGSRTGEENEKVDDEKCQTASGEDGTCKPASTCAFSTTIELKVDSEEEEASTSGNVCSVKSHICCKELLQNNPSIVQKLATAAAANQQEPVAKPEGISINQVEEILVKPRFEAVEAEQQDSEEQSLETSPTNLHLAFNRPRPDALKVDLVASQFESTAQTITDDIGNDIGVRFFNVDTVPRINDACSWTPAPQCDSVLKSKFRTFDGTCNNLKEPNYGRANTPFQRILPSEYSQGSLALPRTDKNGFELPSARKLSTRMTKSALKEDKKNGIHTAFVMQMGQFIDHDITHTPNHAKADCCGTSGTFPASFDSNKCFPIEVPSDDPFWQGKIRCMNFARSLSSPNLKCELESRQQMNQITHWLDASNI